MLFGRVSCFRPSVKNPDREFRDSGRAAAVIPCRLDDSQGMTMRCDEGFHIGYFGDVRRQRAGAALCERVVETGSLVLRHVGSDRRGEMSAQRFLASRDVTHQEILATAGQRTASACAGRRIVAAQDTTEINFKDRDRARKGLGPAGDGQTPGFFCHAMVAIDAEDEALLGVVHARIWTRSSEPVTARRSRPIEQKESIHWIEGTAVAGDRLGSAAQLIVLGDREFDIYEQFVRIPPSVELIVRAGQNRKLADDDKLLFAAASDWREFGAMKVRVPPHRPGEVERIARVGVKAGRGCIAKPGNPSNSAHPGSVAPTMPVCAQPDECTAANQIVQLYRLRWRIEQTFRAMKSDGLRLEETQVQEASRLFKLTAIALIAAARTIQRVDARDGSRRPASDVADHDLITAAEAIG